jgi:hypothetical protein
VHPLCFRYAFAMYAAEEAVEAALAMHDQHQISLDGHILTLINFSAIKDVVNSEATFTYTKGTEPAYTH